MLRLLALLAGLVLALFVLHLAVRTGTRRAGIEPAPVPPRDHADGVPETLASQDAQRHDEAGAALTPESRYVGIQGELRREEDGTLLESAVLSFHYRYVSKGPDSTVKTVPLELDEHGAFEQLFSEPVQIVSVDIEPPDFDVPELTIRSSRTLWASFLHTTKSLDVRVEARAVAIALTVRSGLEIRGRVFDSVTNMAIANAPVFAQADRTRVLCTLTDSTGSFRLRGFDPVLAEPGRSYVDRVAHYDTVTGVGDLVVSTLPHDHRPAKRVVPLPLSNTQPTWVELGVASGFRIAGRVIDGAGRAISGAIAEVVGPDPDAPGERKALQRCRSELDGSFEFACVESLPNAELVLRQDAQGSPEIHAPLVDLHENLDGLEFKLPECRAYYIRGRLPSGEFLDANRFSVLVRDNWGERSVSGTESVPSLRITLAIGSRADLEVVSESNSSRFQGWRGKTSIEPLAGSEELETIVVDLAP